jgi:hypothetical protein
MSKDQDTSATTSKTYSPNQPSAKFKLQLTAKQLHTLRRNYTALKMSKTAAGDEMQDGKIERGAKGEDGKD